MSIRSDTSANALTTAAPKHAGDLPRAAASPRISEVGFGVGFGSWTRIERVGCRLPVYSNSSIANPAVAAYQSCELAGAMNEVLRQQRSTPNHSYTVELRFSGDGLDPSEISRRLCLQPSNSSELSIASSSARKIRPFWACNGQGKEGFQSEWQSLEQGLEFLLRQFNHLRPTVIELSQNFDGLWWCGHFQVSFDGGPTLSPRLLAEIASYGLPLSIDNYFEGK
jgi:hypothetical protein